MSKVWRKLNRVGKKASKYKFTTHSHILTINCTNKWHPDRIRIIWQRSDRKVASTVCSFVVFVVGRDVQLLPINHEKCNHDYVINYQKN